MNQGLTPHQPLQDIMMNLDGFEKFDAQARAPRNKAARIRMNKFDELVIDPEVFMVMGAPDYVYLWYNSDTGEIAIQAAKSAGQGAYQMTKRTGRQRFIACRAFVKRHGIPVGWTVTHPFVNSGIARFTIPTDLEPLEPDNEVDFDA